MIRNTVWLAASALAWLGAVAFGQEPRPSTMAHRSTVYAPHGMIATSQPLATAAGLAVLERGGNAIDAAVTAAAVLNVAEPMMTGIGGDMFAIVWSAKDRKLYGLNSSGRAGRLMSRDAVLARGHRTMPTESVEDVTVPGALAGWQALLQRFGTITLSQALVPAIEYAEHGFPVTPIIARDWAAEAARLARDDGARATFLVDGTRAPREGEWFTNSDLARSFRLIAAQGPAALYGGELGQRIVTRVAQLGGYLTLDDLREHRPEWVEPMSVSFKGYRVWELPPNNQGVAALEMLRMLETYDLRGLGHNSAAYLHLLIEAKKLAFADAAHYIGDPTAMRTPATTLAPVRPWEEADGAPDPEAQRACYDALVRALEPEDWVAGAFFWKWFSSDRIGGPHDSSFTPRGKPAQEVMARAFRQWEGRPVRVPAR